MLNGFFTRNSNKITCITFTNFSYKKQKNNSITAGDAKNLFTEWGGLRPYSTPLARCWLPDNTHQQEVFGILSVAQVSTKKIPSLLTQVIIAFWSAHESEKSKVTLLHGRQAFRVETVDFFLIVFMLRYYPIFFLLFNYIICCYNLWWT